MIFQRSQLKKKIVGLGILLSLSGLHSPLILSAENSPIPIPSQWGRIQNYFQSKNSKSPLLVLIQDAHAQYSAQKSLAEIIRYLTLYHHLDLVMVEGGVKNVDLSYLRTGVSPEHIEEVAEHYLKAGKISGEEYLDLTLTDGDISLWGVEDANLYAQNMEIYLKFQKVQKKAAYQVRALQKNVEAIKKTLYTKDLYSLEQLKRKAERKQDLMLNYFGMLSSQAQLVPIPLDSYPEFSKWLKLMDAQKNMDPGKVEFEKKELMRALSQIATKEEMEPLTRNLGSSAPSDSEMNVLQGLLELKQNYSDKLSKYSTVNLQKAFHVMRATQRVDIAGLFKESEQLFRQIRAHYLVDEKTKALARLSDYLVLVEKLFQLAWTPQNEHDFNDFQPKEILEAGEALLKQSKDLEEIEKKVLEARPFYAVAHKREEAIFINTLAKMKEENNDIYVLITGGYHAADLAAQFNALGYAVLSVSPRFEPSENPNAYFEVLRTKWVNKTQRSSRDL